MGHKRRVSQMVRLTIAVLILAACATSQLIPKPVPPTPTPVPPMPTIVPLTPASVSPKATAAPTATAIVGSTAISSLGPSPRGSVSMAYVAESNRIILFGGQIGAFVGDGYLDYDDTWAYDLTANQWTLMKPPSVPTGRSESELAYDAESDRVILFGGFSNAIFWAVDDWAYDYNTNTWMEITKGPNNRFGTSMAYDAESDRIILFSGWGMNMGGFLYNDTWAYDFNSDTWTEMKPITSPPSRTNHAMAYDSKADKVLMWGGTDLDGKPADFSVWSYDFNTNMWQEMISSQPHPSGRNYPGMVYDAESDRTILFGGELSGESNGEIWAYDYNTNTWTKFESSTGPGYRSRQGMVYSSAADRVILFGGQVESTEPKYSNETWTYDLNTNTWTNMTSHPTASSINKMPMTERVSVASDGTQANNDSDRSSISDDGRYVAFSSSADNLVESDTNGVQDVFVHDRLTGETTRVSVASDGTQANGACATIGCWCILSGVSISADGRYVAFHSDATNLVEGDTNGVTDIFVHDLVTGETIRVSVASDGMQGNGGSSIPSISADGRYVAFISDSTNLVEGVTNGGIFVHDRVTGKTSFESVSSDETQGNEGAGYPTISADGRFVAFSSYSDNLVQGDTNGITDIFVHDRVTGETTLESVSSDGTQGNGWSGATAISADGRYVAFWSEANNLVEGDTNEGAEWFVHDRVTGETTLALVPIANEEPQGKYGYLLPTVSADGRYWTFISDASNLVEGDTNGYYDIFVRDLGSSKFTTVITSENAYQVTQLTSLGTLNEHMRSGPVAFSPNGEILAAGHSEGPVQLYNVLSLKLLTELETEIGFVNSISFSPDGKLLAAGGGQYGPVVERGVQIWDVATQQQVFKFDDFNETVLSVRFSPDGSTLATGWGNPWRFGPGSVKMWSVATGELQAEFGLPSELDPTVCWTVSEVAFNPDGTLLAAMNGNGKVQLWDIASQKEEAVINVVAGYGFGVAFSPDGKLLAASGSTDRHSMVIPDLRLFDVASGELSVRLEGHEFGPEVAFSPNGEVLVSSSLDGTVRLWDVETGKALAILDVPNGANFAFNPDGTLLATGGDVVRLWGVPAH